MKKRSIGIMMVFCLLFGLIVMLEKPQEAQAAKKFEDYMEISTAEDLVDIINEPEGKYYLTKDIDMEEYGLWEPIAGFTGILDGNGRNLELKNVSITTSAGYVGGIVGSLSGSAFRNVTRESEIYVGGICGVTQLGKQKINYCLNTGEVLGDVRGAIVGQAGEDFYSTRCVFLRDTKAEINTGIEWYGGGTINGCTAKVLNSSGLKKQKYYKNWDFENTWSIISGINGGKPMLKSASVVNIYKLDDVKTNVKAGTYDDTQTIELSAAEGAKNYYTLDGSKPSKKSLVYSGPITVSENTTIRAYAVKKGYTSSKAVKFKYKIK